MRRRFLAIVCALMILALAVPAGSARGIHAAQAPRPSPLLERLGVQSHETGIHLTKKTVAVSHSIAGKNLVGISSKGTFTFKTAAGPLGKLKAGKVMLLEGVDALEVTGVSRKHGKLIVATKPATLTNVISSGKVAFSGMPNLEDVSLHPVVVPPIKGKTSKKVTSSWREAVEYSHGGSAAGSALRREIVLSAQGAVGPFGYSLSFTPSSPTHLDMSGTLCFISSSVCGNGPSNGPTAEINLSGYIDAADSTGAVTVNGGSVTNSSFTVKDLKARLRFTYTVKRGEGSEVGADPPVFHVPLGVDYTIPGEIPIYLKLQLALLIKLGISSKNAVIHGGLDVTGTGADSISEQGSHVSDSQRGDGVKGEVLDQSDGGVPPSISAAPSGVVVAIQYPKLGMGLGWTSVNGLGYVDLVSSVGQTTGAVVAGMVCSSYDIDEDFGAGLEAQVGLGKFGTSLATPRKSLYEFKFKTHDPGCPQT